MEKLKIRVITTPVGDRAVSEALERSGAILGGEQAGHIIFRDYLATGDGLLSALMILKVMLDNKKKLSFYNQLFKKFPQILVNLKVKEKISLQDCPNLTEVIQKVESRLGKNGRVLVRYSGTEPLMRIMIEGPTPSQIKKLANTIVQVAKQELGQ
jgi:phosphoglucosamine mutase